MEIEMKKTVAVYTADRYLFQKIRLDAPEGVEVVFGDAEKTAATLVFADVDTVKSFPSGAVTMSRTDSGCDLKIPFPLGTVAALISDETKGDTILTVIAEERAALLKGERIKLTEVEFSLLSALLKRGGGFATRDEILSEVWGDGADSGVINVYIHYLREKLEIHGEKIIISSRKCGYKIDEKYIGGETLCSK